MDKENILVESLLKEQHKTNRKLNGLLVIGGGLLAVGVVDILGKIGAVAVAANAIEEVRGCLGGLFGGNKVDKSTTDNAANDEFGEVK